MDVIARTMADAIKSNPSDGDWVVWITPSDAATRALRGLEAAGYVVRTADDRGAVKERDRYRQAIVQRDLEDVGDPLSVAGQLFAIAYGRQYEASPAHPSSQHSSEEDR